MVHDGLFFFFKQKTAYEMRISDWSSDVCSSDLAAAHAEFDAWSAYLGKWVDDDCCHGVTPDLITPETIEDGVRVMTLDFVIEREQAEQRKSATEIGRASGRTRGCQ